MLRMSILAFFAATLLCAQSTNEAAVRDVLHTDYDGLQQQTIAYLNRAYVR